MGEAPDFEEPKQPAVEDVEKGLRTKALQEEGKLYSCKYCGKTESEKYGLFDSPMKLASHTKFECEEFKKQKRVETVREVKEEIEAHKEVAAPSSAATTEPTPPRADDLTPRQRVAMYGVTELEKMKRETLEKFLSSAPQVGKKVSDWILQQWDLDPNVRSEPNELNNLLRDAAVPAQMAYRATNLLLALDEEMRDVLEQRERGPSFRPRRGPYRRDEGYERPYLRYPDRYGSEEPYRRRVAPGVYQEEEEYPRARAEREYPPRDSVPVEWRIEREVEKATKPLQEKFDKLMDELREGRKEKPEQNVEIWRPKMSEDGQVMTDANGKPVLERILAPASMAHQFMPREDAELNALKKMEYYKTMFAPSAVPSEETLTADKIREIIRSEKEQVTPEGVKNIVSEALKERAPAGPSTEMVQMQGKLEELTKALQTQKEEMAAEKFNVLHKELEEMKVSLRNMSVGEYKEDSMKILSKSIDTFTEVVKERKPLEKAMDRMVPQMPPIPDGAQPLSSQQVTRAPVRVEPTPVTSTAKTTGESAQKKLEEQGFVLKS